MTIEFDLQSDIQKLIDFDALELYIQTDDEHSVAYIPYMMNDAVECYLCFKQCSVLGKWDGKKGAIDYSAVEHDNKKGLILRQSDGNTVSIWYERVSKHVECYQYHRIGHFWVKGQEDWRRLVYIIGTLHDKYTFMGEEICNTTETDLLSLMEFAPFRYWTPIHESLDDYYEDTEDGINCIDQIAERINSASLKKLIASYKKEYGSETLTSGKITKYAKKLSKCEELYSYLNRQIDSASLFYKERNYSETEKKKMDSARREAMEPYTKKAYKGEYPVLKKGKKIVIFYEEHPYVLRDFEYMDYEFKVTGLTR